MVFLTLSFLLFLTCSSHRMPAIASSHFMCGFQNRAAPPHTVTRGPFQGNNYDGRLTLQPSEVRKSPTNQLSRTNAHGYNPPSHINHTGYRNRFLTRYAHIIITIYNYDIIRYTVLIATIHTWTGLNRFLLRFSFHGPYYVQTFEDYHANRLTPKLNYKFLYYNSRTNKLRITLNIPLTNNTGLDIYLIYRPKYVNLCGNFYRPYTGFVRYC